MNMLLDAYTEEERKVMRVKLRGLCYDDLTRWIIGGRKEVDTLLNINNFGEVPLYIEHENYVVRMLAEWRLEIGR